MFLKLDNKQVKSNFSCFFQTKQDKNEVQRLQKPVQQKLRKNIEKASLYEVIIFDTGSSN